MVKHFDLRFLYLCIWYNTHGSDFVFVILQASLSPKTDDQTVITLANQLLADDRIGDLELMLETRETPADREVFCGRIRF